MNHKAHKTQSRPNTVINKVNKVSKVINKVRKVGKVCTVRDDVPHNILNKEISDISNYSVIPPPPTERERVRQVLFLANLT